MILWVDDIREPDLYKTKLGIIDNDIIWVKTYYDYVDWIINNGLPETIAFDHDLGDKSTPEKTGYDCAKYLIEYCLDENKKLPNWVMLSANPVGAKNINKLLENFKKFQK